MRESTLARQVLSIALEHTGRNGGGRIRVVRGRVSETETLSREALVIHFESLARGTLAEGARLEFELVHARARCRACRAEYLPEHHVLLCPRCDSTDGEELDPTGLWVTGLEVGAT